MIDFGKGLPSDRPLTPEVAVRRGHLFITLPVFAIMFGLWGILAALLPNGPLPRGVLGLASAIAIPIGPPIMAWVWWSFAVPRWRHWALSHGVDSDALQRLAERQKLIWPKGHFFEKTEFRYRGQHRSDANGAA